MGTSLKVHGLKRVVKEFAKVVHNRKNGLVVFVNATPPSKEWEGIIDVHIQGQTDTWVERVEEEWKKVRPADWEIQTRLDGEIQVTGGGKEMVKPKAERKPKMEKIPKGEAKPKKETEVKPRVANSGKSKVRPATTKPRGQSWSSISANPFIRLTWSSYEKALKGRARICRSCIPNPTTFSTHTTVLSKHTHALTFRLVAIIRIIIPPLLGL